MTPTQARDYVREATTSSWAHPRTLYVLGIDLDGDLIGIIRLRTTDNTGHLAYILRQDTWGHCCATAAVRLLLTDTTVPLVTAERRVGNPASGRVLAKAGFVQICVTADLVRYETARSKRPRPPSGRTFLTEGHRQAPSHFAETGHPPLPS